MYRAIIFDFFDVILNDPYKAWLTKHSIERVGPYDDITKPLDRGETSVEQFRQKLSEMSGIPLQSIEEEYDKITHVDERMVPLIENLAKNYKLALLSNAGADEIHPLLDAHGHKKLFDLVAVSSEIGAIKPEPEAFRYILDKLGISAKETIFIDDSQHNVEAANILGIKGLLYTDFATLIEDLTSLGIKAD